ncbi:MAG: hypothetical protein LBC40_09375 [Dysgonamonadaceae bacterium]|nr:hypothetical protein [Dysgonamonadaceae bacterium]
MKTIPIIKQSGEIRNRDYALRQLETLFGTIRNGEYVLTLSKQEKKRTLAENRLFWLWMACIEKETGTSKEDCHDYYCSKFLRRHAIINGRETEVTSGTSSLNTVQFSVFLDNIQADAASEFGIKLPDPKDLYWAEFEAYYKNFI